ncbi:hypothetical protein SAMN05443572_1011384 [Myxococcus fulvus]|uniref:DUF6438 domain-containing protein n=2 Tax=Myxococcus fulvus TaxID=33 RepID=A0A511SUC4_MYXFU|nr:hypothetical protein MFU01_01090 [Myxococcus fulvus]SET18926.1 hypothetical protein SAMN05443572_1011384 [Myxococcus fulvus]
MRRTGCEGICPIYRLTVHGDGRVVYDGDFHVKIQGRRESRLTPAQLARLRRTLAEHVKPEVIYGERERNWYTCPHGGIDLAGVVLLAPEVGVSEPICYVNQVLMRESPSLGGVDYLIEEIVGSHRWAGCSDDWKGFGGC